MRLSIPKDPINKYLNVDRDQPEPFEYGEGLTISIGKEFEIHFEDSKDAELIAIMICRRLGVVVSED